MKQGEKISIFESEEGTTTVPFSAVLRVYFAAKAARHARHGLTVIETEERFSQQTDV